ncbi:TraB/GumN family protein [Diaphorobacter caeni]|uniref:TraB/GumN family protein n=1 Tax=Diaphorobacter caeni TaxID=2784387 RepID=UPI00188DD100|nr:TraB/GumN family protein [Diaphorobacter caeni]MBF5002782.1 TraB/GumN family protein [Diaphorobacter caeni]
MRATIRQLKALLIAALFPLAVSAVHAQDPASGAAPSCPPVAQMPDTAMLQAQMRTARDRGLLWRVDKNGRTSWLYGTIHVAKQGWLVPGPTVMKALRDSDALALELNILDPKVLEALMSAMQARPGVKPLPQALQSRLDRLKRRECLDAEVNALRPDAQVLTLASMIARREGLDPNYGIDLMLAGMATGMGKPVLALESVDTQIRELVSEDPEKVVETVSAGLDQLEREDASAVMSTLAHAWSDGRMGLLESYAQWCGCVNTAAELREHQRMVEGRNPGIAREMVKEIASGKRLFSAVGALHMVGEKGLPALLRKQGFTVTRVEFAAARVKAANGE